MSEHIYREFAYTIKTQDDTFIVLTYSQIERNEDSPEEHRDQ